MPKCRLGNEWLQRRLWSLSFAGNISHHQLTFNLQDPFPVFCVRLFSLGLRRLITSLPVNYSLSALDVAPHPDVMVSHQSVRSLWCSWYLLISIQIILCYQSRCCTAICSRVKEANVGLKNRRCVFNLKRLSGVNSAVWSGCSLHLQHQSRAETSNRGWKQDEVAVETWCDW